MLTLEEVQLDNNRADTLGGGLYMDSGELVMLGGSLIYSRATTGGAYLDDLDGASWTDRACPTTAPMHEWPGRDRGRWHSIDVLDAGITANRAYESGGGCWRSAGTPPPRSDLDECQLVLSLRVEAEAWPRRSPAVLSEVSVSRSIFEQNSAHGWGDGRRLISSTFTANLASFGAGLATIAPYSYGPIWPPEDLYAGAPARVENSTFYRNSAYYTAGGLYADEPTEVLHTTFFANSATSTAATIFGAGYVQMRSSIVAALSEPAIPHCDVPVSVGYNVATDIWCLAVSSDTFHPAGLLTYGNHGSPTPTIELSPTSHAIDAADPATCPPIDQRGFPRPAGEGCDSQGLQAPA
ncbi:MAG: choice-of-anchor Q domain-containing protein [Sandaracinaceae bacterium]